LKTAHDSSCKRAMPCINPTRKRVAARAANENIREISRTHMAELREVLEEQNRLDAIAREEERYQRDAEAGDDFSEWWEGR